MKSSISLIRGKQTASRKIVGLMLAVASLWLMLAAANTSAHAQAFGDAIPSSTSASTTASPGDWAQFHRDNMQRWNPYETVIGVNNVGSLKLKWASAIGSINASSPAVVNGVVYVANEGTANGPPSLYALNASTGIVQWSYVGVSGGSSPAVVNGVVYVGCDRAMCALNASTGALLWRYGIFAFFPVRSSPTVVDGVVYFTSSDGNVYALNASTGAKIWNYTTGGDARSSPAVANGVVYVGSYNGNLYALNASTGVLLWSYATAGPTNYVSAAVANGVVYIGSTANTGTVYALNASTGVLLWSYATEEPIIYSSPAVANGVVYVGSTNVFAYTGTVYALNASTGALLWSYNGFGFQEDSPAVANGVVYLSFGNGLYALNASTGAVLWSSGGCVFASPSVANGMVYCGSDQLYAFGLGGASADLFLRVQPSTTTVHQGDLLTYAFPVWNLGPGDAVHEVLNTQVPAGTTFDYVRISGTPGLGTCTHPPYQGTGQIICHENASMAPNTTWTVRLTVRVTAPSGTVITESAATMADTFDPNMANNTATVSTTVQ